MIDEMTLAKMADMLSIASDTTRLKILVCLLGEDFSLLNGHKCVVDDNLPGYELNVSGIVEKTGASQSLVSHQLKILKDAGLVDVRRDGRQMFYSLSDGHVKELVEVVLEHVCEE
ncbi:MAG: helix-turn-helix transcriptional regulator [Bacilli bacterium]|nr:helix-turn-helix transcriptional regulator [Bacilli bacterium]